MVSVATVVATTTKHQHRKKTRRGTKGGYMTNLKRLRREQAALHVPEEDMWKVEVHVEERLRREQLERANEVRPPPPVPRPRPTIPAASFHKVTASRRALFMKVSAVWQSKSVQCGAGWRGWLYVQPPGVGRSIASPSPSHNCARPACTLNRKCCFYISVECTNPVVVSYAPLVRLLHCRPHSD